MYLNVLWWQIMAISCTVIVQTSSEMQSVNHTCETTGQTFTCDHDLPHLIPKHITEVYIVNYRHDTVTRQKHAFDDLSWNTIKKLTITSPWINKINDNDFYALKYIRTLGIHSNTLSEISQYGFSGLEQLIHLDLAGCEDLTSGAIVVPLLINNSTPHLKSLDLGQLQSRKWQQFQLNEDFMRMIQKKNIETISLSGTDVLVQDLRLFYIESSLQHLDVSNITAFVTDLVTSSLHFINIPIFQNIKTLNCSNSFRRFISRTVILDNIYKKDICYRGNKILKKLISLDVSYNNFEVTIIQNINLSSCNFDLKYFYSQGNCIKKLNATVFWPKSTQFVEVNLSLNKLTYLSPTFFYQQHSIKTLMLSNNSLFQMEKYPEFEQLLGTFSQLEHFDIACNALTLIPYLMFQYNTRLKVIILKGNHLTGVNFKIRHLLGLKRLDLQSNRIIYIDGNGFGELKYTLQTAENDTIEIDFQSNPLQCSCKSIAFITWLETKVSPLTQAKLECEFEGGIIEINNVALDRTKYLCHRTMIITTAFIGVIVLLAIVTFVVLMVQQKIRKRDKKNITKRFLNDFKNGRLDEKQLLFLSYCNDDGNFVLKHIFKEIDKTLKDVSELNKMQIPVCGNGDLNFTPGCSIVTEIMRCDSQACVVAFVVSRAFCASDWCRMEIKEAYEQDKPIILIFKENVEKKLMPSYLWNIFQRHVRVKLVQIDGQYELVPSWRALCESIVLLASAKEHYKRQNKINMERDRDIDLAVQEPFLAAQNEK